MLIQPSLIEILAGVAFAMAIVHTFSSSYFRAIAGKFREGSVGENLFHLLGEVEVVFGLWAALFLGAYAFIEGAPRAIAYAESLDFTEPLFVFAIMSIAATRPIISFARRLIIFTSNFMPFSKAQKVYIACLIVGPLLGSFITEPAAMTVTALILRDLYFSKSAGRTPFGRFRYVTLAVLFVNVSIGGILTPFAAPPVLMVATKWNWTTHFMLVNFGWRAVIAVVVNAVAAAFFLKSDLELLNTDKPKAPEASPVLMIGLHLAFLTFVVLTSHHPVIFMGAFLIFLGVVTVTREFQRDLLLNQSLLVAFFLAGLVVLGGMQAWWLKPLLANLSATALFFGTTALTAATDNAALTYLGSQLGDLTAGFQYALVAGAVAGGGLTVIANAPNPAGYSILQESFGRDGISGLKLILAALPPTLIAIAAFAIYGW